MNRLIGGLTASEKREEGEEATDHTVDAEEKTVEAEVKGESEGKELPDVPEPKPESGSANEEEQMQTAEDAKPASPTTSQMMIFVS